MKILSIGNFGLGWDGSVCDEAHIANALEELGHEVTRCQREESYDLNNITDSHFDFILIAQWDGYEERMYDVFPKCPIVYWAFDYQEDGQEWHERLIEGADLYLSKPFKDAKYPNWRWLCQDFAPMFLNKMPDWHNKIEQDIDVLFTGSYVPWESGQERVKYLKAIDEKYNLQINSVTPQQWIDAGFKNVQGPVMDDALPALIARAKVNFSMDHVSSPGYWSDRNAQIMACGGLVLFKYVPGSTQVFGDGVEYFHSIEGCLDLIETWLGPLAGVSDVRAEWGRAHARANLMVDKRVKDFLTIVGEVL